jgi:hypothetical protein
MLFIRLLQFLQLAPKRAFCLDSIIVITCFDLIFCIKLDSKSIAGLVQPASKFTKRIPRWIPLLGERTQVRASVKPFKSFACLLSIKHDSPVYGPPNCCQRTVQPSGFPFHHPLYPKIPIPPVPGEHNRLPFSILHHRSSFIAPLPHCAFALNPCPLSLDAALFRCEFPPA